MLLQVRFALEVVFEGVEGTAALGGLQAEAGGALRVGDAVTITHELATDTAHDWAVMEWEAGARADMLADAVVATIMQVLPPPFTTV